MVPALDRQLGATERRLVGEELGRDEAERGWGLVGGSWGLKAEVPECQGGQDGGTEARSLGDSRGARPRPGSQR